MTPKLLQGSRAVYEKTEYDPTMAPVIKRALGDTVLVLPDPASGITKGGINIDDKTKERMSLASETGVIVAMGDGAFLWTADRTRPFVGERPKVGQRVYFERYAGQELIGADGEMYRLMTDKAIGAEALD